MATNDKPKLECIVDTVNCPYCGASDSVSVELAQCSKCESECDAIGILNDLIESGKVVSCESVQHICKWG